MKKLSQAGFSRTLIFSIIGISILFAGALISFTSEAQGQPEEDEYALFYRDGYIEKRTVESSELIYPNGLHRKTFFPTAVFIKEEGYKSLTEVMNITWQNGAINFSHNDYWFTLQPLVIYNGQEKTISDIKQSFPNVILRDHISVQRYRYKFAINISNVPQNLVDNTDAILFKITDWYNITGNDIVKTNDQAIIIKDIVRIDYGDLIDSGFTINLVNKTHLYIGNIAENYIDGQLYLDPLVKYNFTDRTNNLAWEQTTGDESSSPPGFDYCWGGSAATTTDYDNMEYDDTSEWLTSSGAKNDEPYQTFNFTINEDSSKITNLTVYFIHGGSMGGGESGRVNYANFATEDWVQFSSSSGSEQEGTVTLESNIENFIDSENQFSICHIGRSLDSGDSIYTDWVQIEITYTLIPPKFQDPAINESGNVFSDKTINHTITITDSPTQYLFAWNATGAGCDTWVNSTWTDVSGSTYTGWNVSDIPAACDGKMIGWRFYGNNSDGINASDIQTYQVWEYGELLVNITSPDDDSAIIRNTTFWLNATVECNGGSAFTKCGDVEAYARYGDGGAADTIISITDQYPMYISGGSSGGGSKITVETGTSYDDYNNLLYSHRVVRDSNDNIYAMIKYNNGGVGNRENLTIFKMSSGSGSFSPLFNYGGGDNTSVFGALSIDSNDKLHLVMAGQQGSGASSSYDTKIFYVKSDSSGTFEIKEDILSEDDIADDIDGVDILIDSNDIPHILFDYLDSSEGGWYNYYTNRSGGSWGNKEAVTINTGTGNFFEGILAINSSGTIFAGIASDYASDFRVYLYTDDGTNPWNESTIDTSGTTATFTYDYIPDIIPIGETVYASWRNYTNNLYFSEFSEGSWTHIHLGGSSTYKQPTLFYYEDAFFIITEDMGTSDIVMFTNKTGSWESETLETGTYYGARLNYQLYSMNQPAIMDYVFISGSTIYYNYYNLGTAENPQSLGSMSSGDTLYPNWTINATGPTTNSYEVDIFFNSSLDSDVVNNHTGDRTICIDSCGAADTGFNITWTDNGYTISADGSAIADKSAWFNNSNGDFKNVNATIEGSNWQTLTYALINFTNEGDVAQKVWLWVDSALPSYIKLFYSLDNDPDTNTHSINNSEWALANKSVGVGESEQIWIWTNFTNAVAGVTKVNIYINTTEV